MLKKIVLISFAVIITFVSLSYGYFYYVNQPINIGNTWATDNAFNINDVTSMQVNENNNFSILRLSDLHLRIGFTSEDKKTLNGVKALIKQEEPDLVVVTGDLVHSPFNFLAMRAFANIMETNNQYWTLVFGNHDGDFGFSKSKMVRMLKNEYDYCLIKNGPSNIKGNSNYFINLKQQDEVVYNLSFLDSNDYIGNTSEFEYLTNEQKQWYKWSMNNINNSANKTVSSMSFFHIALKEYLSLYETNNFVGRVGYRGIRTQRNVNLFDVMQNIGSTKAIFVGHDHLNTMRGYYENIYLCYGRWSGVRPYHGNMHPEIKRGATLIQIDTNEDTFEVSDVFYDDYL
jgi:predicted MPP superfamily phosphohydrolase